MKRDVRGRELGDFWGNWEPRVRVNGDDGACIRKEAEWGGLRKGTKTEVEVADVSKSKRERMDA